jgi:hypothetical protein
MKRLINGTSTSGGSGMKCRGGSDITTAGKYNKVNLKVKVTFAAIFNLMAKNRSYVTKFS